MNYKRKTKDEFAQELETRIRLAQGYDGPFGPSILAVISLMSTILFEQQQANDELMEIIKSEFLDTRVKNLL